MTNNSHCNQLLYTLAENSNDQIAGVDKDFCFTFFNSTYRENFKKAFGQKIEIGQHLPTILSNHRYRLPYIQYWTQALQGDTFKSILEIDFNEREKKYFELHQFPIINEAQMIAGAIQISKDITEHTLREMDISNNKNFYTLANLLPQIVWTATPDGLLDYFNEQWYTYSGMDFNTSRGNGWASAIHPEDISNLGTLWQQCLLTGNSYYVQARVRDANGNYRWLLIRALPYKNNKHEIVHWYGTCTDIEEQKESEIALQSISMELKKANEEIQLRNQRLTRINADLDTFVYTASHDLKSPIHNIESLVNSLYEVLNAPVHDKEESILLLSMIDQSIERFKNTINDLAEVAKVQNEELEDEEEIDFEVLLKEVIQSLNWLISKYHANIFYDFSNTKTIRFSTKNLRSIYYNLISNAIKYSAPERPPKVVISTEFLDQYILLTIKDNGLGIRDQDREKVFKIFKRLHLHVEGSGVGMTIVKKIIDNNGGKIEIESEIGQGTTFKIYFLIS